MVSRTGLPFSPSTSAEKASVYLRPSWKMWPISMPRADTNGPMPSGEGSPSRTSAASMVPSGTKSRPATRPTTCLPFSSAWITGADEKGKHVVGLVAGRDFVPDGTIEAAEVRDGDPSPDGMGPLVSARGIEIGHIFQLGRKYTDAFSADVLGENGKPVRLTMGSYGVGVSRLVAVIAEQHHDELGLRWPASVSPFDAHVVIANKDEGAWTGGTGLAG